ncbi:MAG: TIGR02147 family protein [Fibrobacterota bacterium]
MRRVYDYLNYREFMRAYYKHRKEENRNFSLRVFGRLTDIDASYLSKVIKEQRHLGEQYIPNIAAALKLDPSESDYFENLVYFNKARTEDNRQLYFERILAIRKPHTQCITEDQYEFYAHWYYSAVRNMLEFFPFHRGDSYAQLARGLNPAITEEQARSSLELLLRLDLIKCNDAGRYILTDNAITTGESWTSIAVRKFQNETIELSRQALSRHPRDERDISSVTMNITGEELSAIKKMLRRFRSSVISYVNHVDAPTRVYQLNLQLIPLTDEYGKESRDEN